MFDNPASYMGSDTFGQLSDEEAQRLAMSYDQQRDPQGFVSASAGRRVLEKTGLQNDMLVNIWELSDLDRDGRLSLREFVCAMRLAEQARGGLALPYHVSAEQQQTLVQFVEQRLANNRAGDAPEAYKPQQHEDFSTADTGGPDAYRNVGRGVPADAPPPGGSPARGRDVSGTAAGLGQLASIFEAAARQDNGSLQQFAAEVIRERQELEEQLARRRDYEQELNQVSIALDRLRDDRRIIDAETTAVRSRVGHMQEDITFIEEEIRIAEGDLSNLRDASGMNFRDYPNDPIAGAMSEKQQLLMDQNTIREIRAKLLETRMEKNQLQASQQSLIEQQRHIEHDRSLTLTAIQAERGKLATTKQQRLKMYEERHALEEELLQHYAQGDLAEMPVMQPPPSTPLAGGGGSNKFYAGSPAASSPLLPGSARPPVTSPAGARRSDHRGVRHDTVPLNLSSNMGPPASAALAT